MPPEDDPARRGFETTALAVPQAAYPSEVMCRRCRNLMLPGDAEGRTWDCWICRRRIEIELRPPA